MAAARDGADSAPMAMRRSWISARRVRFGVFGFVQQGQAFGVALQHGVEQGGWAGRRFLRDGREAGARGQADISPVERKVAGDGAQQRGFAGAVAADQADAAAGIDRQVRGVEQGAAAEADGDGGDGQEGHGGEGDRASWGWGSRVIYC